MFFMHNVGPIKMFLLTICVSLAWWSIVYMLEERFFQAIINLVFVEIFYRLKESLKEEK